MADGDQITIEDAGTRVPLRDRPQRHATADDGPKIAVEEATLDAPVDDTEKQLAETAKMLEQSRAREQELERARTTEAEGRSRAEREALRQRTLNATSRQAVVASAVESAAADLTRAKQAFRLARENGDIDAESTAAADIAAASTRHTQAAQELALIKAGAGDATSAAGDMTDPAGDRPAQQRSAAPSAAAAAWIAKHPRFTAERGYRDAILKAHTDAMNDGIQPDTAAYFRELDQVAKVLEGGDSGGDHQMQNGRNAGERRQGFDGATPSRNGGNSGGTKTVETALGNVTVGRRADGTITLKVDPSKVEDFKEGASVCGMEYAEYVHEQVKIAEQYGKLGTQNDTLAERVFR